MDVYRKNLWVLSYGWLGGIDYRDLAIPTSKAKYGRWGPVVFCFCFFFTRKECWIVWEKASDVQGWRGSPSFYTPASYRFGKVYHLLIPSHITCFWANSHHHTGVRAKGRLPDMFVQSEIVHCITERRRGKGKVYPVFTGQKIWTYWTEARPLERHIALSLCPCVCDSPITIMLIFISRAHYSTEGNTGLLGKINFKAFFASCPYWEGTVPALQQEMSFISTQTCQ